MASIISLDVLDSKYNELKQEIIGTIITQKSPIRFDYCDLEGFPTPFDRIKKIILTPTDIEPTQVTLVSFDTNETLDTTLQDLTLEQLYVIAASDLIEERTMHDVVDEFDNDKLTAMIECYFTSDAWIEFGCYAKEETSSGCDLFHEWAVDKICREVRKADMIEDCWVEEEDFWE